MNNHEQNAALARKLYLDQLDAEAQARDWHLALRMARNIVAKGLRASSYLRDVPAALMQDGGHMLAFRHLTAPPMSQDQFLIRCSEWSKSSEKNGSPLSEKVAAEVAAVFEEWRDDAIGNWLRDGRKPTTRELREVFQRVSGLIAQKMVDTARRNRLAKEQEEVITELLESMGWERLPSKLIDHRGAVPCKCFMHKTRFAASQTSHQEVDIACGLQNTYVLAMECKVTNDETNSVKRINDVLKKASAWKRQWGNFVETAALLQGVIAAKDVHRLEHEGVHVFWSHDLTSFSNWLQTRV